MLTFLICLYTEVIYETIINYNKLGTYTSFICPNLDLQENRILFLEKNGYSFMKREKCTLNNGV